MQFTRKLTHPDLRHSTPAGGIALKEWNVLIDLNHRIQSSRCYSNITMAVRYYAHWPKKEVDRIVVRIFPLQHRRATRCYERVSQSVSELFSELLGENVSRVSISKEILKINRNDRNSNLCMARRLGQRYNHQTL